MDVTPHKDDDVKTYEVPSWISKGAHISSLEQYKALYERSIKDGDNFWAEMAKTHLSWIRPFETVKHGSFEHGDIAWFLEGQLNAAYNCIDRHVTTKGNQVAILWEGDDSKDIRRITYNELLREVCKFANVLKRLGVRKGDPVCIYMPMVPEAAYAMLACARIGAPHSVVFAGFSAEALRDRILDCRCKFVVTADEGRRGGKVIPLKALVDLAVIQCPTVQHVVVLRHTGGSILMSEKKNELGDPRDFWWHDLMHEQRPYCPPEPVNSEDTLFMLYTSGSTGKPKGVAHTTAGYLLYTMMTHKYVFDYRDGDVYACVADVGWITGHSYIVYGPLLNGATTFMFEGTPMHPDAGRYWDMVERHKITQFYTAPTAIRALMKFGSEPVKKYNRNSLRVLGSVGEPINPEAWRWYYEVVGDSKRTIVDTFWQTETGGIVITPLPGATPTKPGSATLPFFGVEPVLLDPHSGQLLQGNNVSGVLCFARPWPSITRTIFGDHARYLKTYMHAYHGLYFTGDGCTRDQDGYYWITGRVDDVINVSGHRIGSAEVESALVLNPSVAEAAVVGVPHDIKGQALFAYVTPKNDVDVGPELVNVLKLEVRKHIGAFAVPDYIIVTAALPKTRSGKIMRRLLRKIACHETAPESLGDISTLADPSVVSSLITEVNKLLLK